VTGVGVADGDLEQALAHLAACDLCGPRLELAPTAACEEVEEDLPAAARVLRDGEQPAARHPALARHLEDCERCRAILAELMREPTVLAAHEARVDPGELFERSLTAALTEPEPIVRARAAERLGAAERVGPAALAALAEAAAEDPDSRVRAAALRGLDELDAAVSIPQRLIEAWSEAPAEAAPFLEGVLARLAGEGPAARAGVAELVASTWTPEQQAMFSGKEGISARLSAEQGELRLILEGLPPVFEKTTPVIAAPHALRATAPRVEWFSKDPGLVRAQMPVTSGRLDVRLGRVLEPPAEKAGPGDLGRLYVLSPESSRKKA
jgi:hypothetical protein